MMQLKELSCPNCGTALNPKNPNTRTVVCPSCNSHVGVGLGEPELMKKARKIKNPPKPIQLGDRAKIAGNDCVVLGRVEYEGWSPVDKSDKWYWTEWLMGAENGSMFWLTYDTEAGFVVYRKQRIRYPFDVMSGSVIQLKLGQARVKERYPARILGAEGELTWKAEPNDQLGMIDAYGNGRLYSVQYAKQELEMYEGVRMDEEDIAKAFNNKKWLEKSKSRARRQQILSFAGASSLIFALVGLALGVIFTLAGDRMATETVTLTSSNPSATIPVSFEANRPIEVELKMQNVLPLNTYTEVEVSIIDPANEEHFVFSKEFWHETGTDEDGRWEEDDYNEAGKFVPTDEGDYLIKLNRGETTASGTPVTMEVEVHRGKFVTAWVFAYGVIIGIVGFMLMGAAHPTTAGNIMSSFADD